MSGWWGSKQAAEPPPRSNEERMTAMRRKRDAMERRRQTIADQIRQADADAQRAAAEGNRAAAAAALKRRRAREAEASQVGKLIAASDQQVAAIEQAALSASMAESVRDGAAVMATVHAQLDPAAIERDMVSMQVQAREADYITRMMTRPLGATHSLDDDVEDDADIADELASIMQSAALTAAAPPTTTPVTRQPVDLQSLEASLGL